MSEAPARQVISASRRTDLPMRYPGWLAQVIRDGQVHVPQPYSGRVRLVSLRPEEVHTVVLWSKDYWKLLANDGGLAEALGRYDQLFCHLTITGLGGTPMEPNIRPWADVVGQLSSLTRLVGDARRVTVRFDPIVHWRENGSIRSNYPLAEEILTACAAHGVQTIRISFATLYGKVKRRQGWNWYDPPRPDRMRMTKDLVSLAQALGLSVYACGDKTLKTAGAIPSKCIDGELLTELHPLGLAAAMGKDAGQRGECGCTPSVDIGSYDKRCPNGCRYCYANPIID